jgi:hypothetical protein
MSHSYNSEDYSEDKIQKALRDYDDVVSDLSSSNYKTFTNNLQQYLHVINTSKIISQVISNRLPDIDFQTWYSKAKAIVGGMVGSGNLDWPLEKNQKLAHQLELLKTIAEGNEDIISFCSNFMYVENNFDSMTYEFIRQIVDPFTRDIKRLIEDEIAVLLSKASTDDSDSYIEEPETMVKLFISHSSKDATLADALAELLGNSLKLSADEIRCTSVEGHRLPVGAKTDDRLRQEISVAKAFVGLISKATTDSMYVLFELGARWGTGKNLLPLLAHSVPPDVLKGPLSGYNALSCDNRSQLHQLISDVANILEITPEKPASYERYIKKVLSIPPAKVENSSKDGDEVLEFDRRSGIYISKKDRLGYCPNCWHSSSEKIPLKEQENGWRCNVCGKFYSNPDYNPPPPRIAYDPLE